MWARISRDHGCGGPHVVGAWPYTYYVQVRNEMIQSWVDKANAVRKAMGKDDVTTIEM